MVRVKKKKKKMMMMMMMKGKEETNNDEGVGDKNHNSINEGMSEVSDGNSEKVENIKYKKGEIKAVELVQGKRFSTQEDAIIKESVYENVEKHNLGEDGLNMVLKSSRELKRCWNEIAAAIPYRCYKSVYHHAQKVFLSRGRKWTEEEYTSQREFQEKTWESMVNVGRETWLIQSSHQQCVAQNKVAKSEELQMRCI
ncbi:unnamed protein product [Cuscuta campestris]|uniref:Myb-like domain-containing protein n=1 Tax=Cuscuta campestris TaxID=132261 RepID=A0A484KH55_9ASTE|nr:unnamed protein product [Cuscuta campestris]